MMIPRIAHFYWAGKPMSALRAASIQSFKQHNPEWEVRVHGHKHEDKYRDIILESDLMRYTVLHGVGGYYFDTDIIFRRPIPDSWLQHDNACVMYDGGVVRGVAILGAKPGSVFFKRLAEAALERSRSPIVCDFQALGVKLVHNLTGPSHDMREYAANCGEGMWNIPHAAFFPVDWCFVELLWSPGYPDLTNDTIGIHWFGGDRLSQEYEAMPELPDCMVRSVLHETVPQP